MINKFFCFFSDVKLLLNSDFFLRRNQKFFLFSVVDPFYRFFYAIVYCFFESLYHIYNDKNFSSLYYLKENNDVRVARVNPLVHYLRFGIYELREPIEFLEAKFSLAPSDFDFIVEAHYKNRFENSVGYEKNKLGELLVNFYLLNNFFDDALSIIGDFPVDHVSKKLKLVEKYIYSLIDFESRSVYSQNCVDSKYVYLNTLLGDVHPYITDNWICAFNSFSSVSDESNLIFNAGAHSFLGCLKGRHNEYQCGPLVSIIVPTYNCSSTINQTLQSIVDQSYQSYEVIIVDDFSTDGTVEKIKEYLDRLLSSIQRDKFSLISNSSNRGVYYSRNKALVRCKGKYVTVLDGDDFLMPNRLGYQVDSLLSNRKLVASISSWARISENGEFIKRRLDENIVHMNLSSLLFCRCIVSEIGGWDEVRFSGDSEFYERILTVYGENSVDWVLPSKPLSLGRYHKASLTNHKSRGYASLFYGARRDYLNSYQSWHKNTSNNLLKINIGDSKRKFCAPTQMFDSNFYTQTYHTLKQAISFSLMWNEAWYVACHPNLVFSDINPIDHFILSFDGTPNDPSPLFSVSAYLKLNKRLNAKSLLSIDFWSNAKKPQYILGLSNGCDNRESIILVGHQAKEILYGSEKSLLDLAKAYHYLGYKVVVILPHYLNEKYIKALQQLAVKIYFFPNFWWKKGVNYSQDYLKLCRKLRDDYSPKLVHVNSLAVNALVEAFSDLGVKVVVHVREAYFDDPFILQHFEATIEDINKRLKAYADIIVANSDFTENFLLKNFDNNKVVQVSNVVCSKKFLMINKNLNKNKRLVVGFVSSLTEAKGLSGYLQLAHLLKEYEIDFYMYGHLNEEHIDIPSNVYYQGYVDDTSAAYLAIDVLVSMSEFGESFGRTILEAMFSGVPCVVYDRGEPANLILKSKGGKIVAKCNSKAIAGHILEYYHNRESIILDGIKGREYALENHTDVKYFFQIKSIVG